MPQNTSGDPWNKQNLSEEEKAKWEEEMRKEPRDYFPLFLIGVILFVGFCIWVIVTQYE